MRQIALSCLLVLTCGCPSVGLSLPEPVLDDCSGRDFGFAGEWVQRDRHTGMASAMTIQRQENGYILASTSNEKATRGRFRTRDLETDSGHALVELELDFTDEEGDKSIARRLAIAAVGPGENLYVWLLNSSKTEKFLEANGLPDAVEHSFCSRVFRGDPKALVDVATKYSGAIVHEPLVFTRAEKSIRRHKMRAVAWDRTLRDSHRS